ncbi:hypothetical protein QP157_20860 [Sphingomonas sp. LR61]|uniref:hypothetical protein n=1 Tax=Bacteria TaxID=2 RepID=UPI001066A5C0|nr:hypothetical protein [Curtobacterium sp. PhB25]
MTIRTVLSDVVVLRSVRMLTVEVRQVNRSQELSVVERVAAGVVAVACPSTSVVNRSGAVPV